MIIRPASTEDAGAIAILCTQLGYPSTHEQVVDRMATLGSSVDHTVLIAEEHDRVLGFMQVSVHRSIESGAWTEIDGLVVDTSHRGRGIGKSLVAEARAWARARGMTRLRVRTNQTRADAHHFYEREGFAVSKSQRVYDRPV